MKINLTKTCANLNPLFDEDIIKAWRKSVAETAAGVLECNLDDWAFMYIANAETVEFMLIIDQSEEADNPKWRINISEALIQHAEDTDDPEGVLEMLEKTVAAIKEGMT